MKPPASKTSSTKLPAVSKKGGKDEDAEDDPIAKSLKEREKAGGINSVVADKGGDKKDSKKTLAGKVGTKVTKDIKEEVKKEESKKEEKKVVSKEKDDKKKPTPPVVSNEDKKPN